mmetsp:Transcript_8945/g.8847  ORF Transcript_8945/g.8847 Transcript_8945/m.8847 type:complete len:119 (+) Transcript_8945:105-461(+)
MMDTHQIEMLMQEPMILTAILIPILYIVYTHLTSKNVAIEIEAASKSKRVVNLSIKKSEPKVVDKIDCGEIENLAEYSNGKLVMCRCWRSKTFPYCDGSHVAHNKETGDNVGPLLIVK